MPTRLYWRDTVIGDDGFPVWALNETMGTAATTQVNTANTDTWENNGAWRAEVGEHITGTSFPTSFVILARGNSAIRIRVERRDSDGTVLAASEWGTERITVATHTETFTLDTDWQPGDVLAVQMQGRRAPGTHGGSTADIGVNREGSFVDATFAAVEPVVYDGTGNDTSTSAESGVAEVVGAPVTYDATGADASASSEAGAAEIPVAPTTEAFVRFPAPDYATTPGKDVWASGDFELRARLDMLAWQGDGNRRYWFGQRGGLSDYGISWNLEGDGRQRLIWTDSGLGTNIILSSGSLTIPAETVGPLWIRAVRIGTGYWYYWSADGEAWTSMGSGTSTLNAIAYDSARNADVGAAGGNGVLRGTWDWDLYRLQVWTGGDASTGTLRYDFDADRAEAGQPASFVAATGETWTFVGTAYEVFPGAADTVIDATGNDQSTSAQAGIGTTVLTTASSDQSASSESGTSTRETSVLASDQSSSAESGAASTVLSSEASDASATSESSAATTSPTASGANASSTTEAGLATAVAYPTGSDASASTESGTSTPSYSAAASDASASTETGAATLDATVSASDTSTSTQQGTAQVVGAPSETYDAVGSSTSASAQTGAGVITTDATADDASNTSELGIVTADRLALGTSQSDSSETNTSTAIIGGAGADESTTSQLGGAERVTAETADTGADTSTSSQDGSATLDASTTGEDQSVTAEVGVAASTLPATGTNASASTQAGAAEAIDNTETLDATGTSTSTSSQAGVTIVTLQAIASNVSGSAELGDATVLILAIGVDASASSEAGDTIITATGAGSDTSASAESGSSAAGDRPVPAPDRIIRAPAPPRNARARDSPRIVTAPKGKRVKEAA